jgi:hypothetical protein
MSTSETSTFPANVCPCGQGSIVKHVTTQDNPWSSADISYELACKVCAGKWRMESGGLVLVESEKSFDAANQAARRTWKDLREISSSLVDDYFDNAPHKSKKAQWEAMTELQIYRDSYRNYLRRRADGETPGSIAVPRGNVPWLLSLAKAKNRLAETNAAIEADTAARKTCDEEAKKIVRWPKEAKKSL